MPVQTWLLAVRLRLDEAAPEMLPSHGRRAPWPLIRGVAEPLILDPEADTMSKKGLLIAPAFPADSYWSFNYILPWSDKRAVCPPLGLITFASYLSDDWELELIDLPISELSDGQLRQKIEEATAVFVSAMYIQMISLNRVLSQVAAGVDTPWILRGPIASTYWDWILHPQIEADKILHDGIDLVVWGEARLWGDQIEKFIEGNPIHCSDSPAVFLPPQLVDKVSASRKHLWTGSYFKSSITHLYRAGTSLRLKSTRRCRFKPRQAVLSAATYPLSSWN